MIDYEELTPLQRVERQAMLGDQQAVLELVGAVRRYREIGRMLLDPSRWTDHGRIFYFEMRKDPRDLIPGIENLDHE